MWEIRSSVDVEDDQAVGSPEGSRSSTAGVPLTQVAVAERCRR